MASQVKFDPRARLWTVENRGIDYKEEWRQDTPLSESNTIAEWLRVNSVDRDTIF